MRLDLPALGKPTSATSATLLSSSTTSRTSPGSPSSAKPGALRLVLARRGVAEPALAALGDDVACRPRRRGRRAGCRPRRRRRCRSGRAPRGRRPWRRCASSPGPACRRSPCGAGGSGGRAATWCPTRTTRTTSPPSPPSAPSGPPSGLNFSRRTLAQPLPPSPAATCRTARSTNVAMRVLFERKAARAGPACAGPPSDACCVQVGQPTWTMLTVLRPRLAPNCTAPGLEREQRVVAATADAVTGVEVGAALADEDLAGLDDLAAEALHAEELRVGVATVARGARALLVSHGVFYFPVSMAVTRTCVSRWRWPRRRL